jgi:hypothetical protein
MTHRGKLAARPARQEHTLQFRIELLGIEPAIWRRIEVPARYTFWDLHVAIQDAMGWRDSHLHAFRLPDRVGAEEVWIGIPDPEPFEGDPDILPGWALPVTLVFRPGDSIEYEYDFGDGWMHEVRSESAGLAEPGAKYPRCTGGERACPPEDSGGPPGYADLLDALRDTAHPEHSAMRRWAGRNFDPERFDPAKVKFQDPLKRWREAFGSDPASPHP